MPKNSSQLSGQIGENLVVAELGRRGIIATANIGANVKDIDVLAYKDGKAIAIQVKAYKTGSLRTEATTYLNIDYDEDTETQTILGKNKNIDRKLIWVIVKLGAFIGDDRFYICKKGKIQDLVYNEHEKFLKKHNGRRPRNPKSFDCSVEFKYLSDSLNDWSVIENQLVS